MLIEDDITLSYDDICLIPLYSDLESRSDAKITFKSYRNPIVASPMIHTSSKRMLGFFVDNNMIPTVHRYFKNAEEQLEHVKDAVADDYQAVFLL